MSIRHLKVQLSCSEARAHNRVPTVLSARVPGYYARSIDTPLKLRIDEAR